MTDARYEQAISAPPDDVDTVHALVSTVWAQHPDIPDLEQMRFETALVELMSNVFRHSGAGSVDSVVRITVGRNELVAVAIDSAAEVTADLGGTTMPGDDLAESGRGMAMIHALVDEFDYSRVDEHNRWRIVRRWARA